MSAIRYKFTAEDMEASNNGHWVRYHDYRLLEEALERIVERDSSSAQVIALRALNGFANETEVKG